MSNDPQSARSFCTVKVLFFLFPAQILEVGIGKADGRTNRNVTMTTHARTGKPDIAKLFSPETKFGIAGEGGREGEVPQVGRLRPCCGADLPRTANVAHMEQGGAVRARIQ